MTALLCLLLVALAAAWVAESRARTRRLNEAVHELRRPLHLLALSLHRSAGRPDGALACIERAGASLADLDAAVNGTRPEAGEPVPLSDLLGAAARRWRCTGRVSFSGAPAEAELPAGPGVATALDNLIDNALEHGRGPVHVSVEGRGGGTIELAVENRQAPEASSAPRPPRRDPRRGHGLRLVSDAAATEGGTVELGSGPHGGARASLRLPGRDPDARAEGR